MYQPNIFTTLLALSFLTQGLIIFFKHKKYNKSVKSLESFVESKKGEYQEDDFKLMVALQGMTYLEEKLLTKIIHIVCCIIQISTLVWAFFFFFYQKQELVMILFSALHMTCTFLISKMNKQFNHQVIDYCEQHLNLMKKGDA